MATIRDVAGACGVSIATVSRVFNASPRVSRPTRERVEAAAAKLDYWPNSAARSLTTNHAHALGVLLPGLYGEFFSEVIRGIDDAARREKLQILVSSSHTESDTLLWAARSMRGRIDGLIMMAPHEHAAPVVEQIARAFPVVLMNTRPGGGRWSSVSIANFDGAYAVAQHLLQQGHRSIATIRGPDGNVDADERLRGFRAAVSDCALQGCCVIETPGDFTESCGYRAASAILRAKPRPTAVFAGNDSMAIGLVSALRDAGVEVPGDIAVAGFDDIPIARYMSPRLTTVRVDAYELGSRAVLRWLANRRTHRQDASHEVLPTTLVVRESCGTHLESAYLQRRFGGASILTHGRPRSAQLDE